VLVDTVSLREWKVDFKSVVNFDAVFTQNSAAYSKCLSLSSAEHRPETS